RLGTKFRMAPDQRLVIAHEDSRVAVVLGLDKEDRPRLQLVQKDAAFNLGLHNVGVDLVTQIGVGGENNGLQVRVHAGFPLHRRLHYSPVSRGRKVNFARLRSFARPNPVAREQAYRPSSPASPSTLPGFRPPSPTRASPRG